MRRILPVLAVLWFVPLLLLAQILPAGESEALTYDVNWPSGLTLGEAQFKASKAGDGDGGEQSWNLQMSLDAAIPGFSVTDRYLSTVNAAGCSLQFEKDVTRGKKTGKERVIFDQAAGSAKRETVGGGESKLSIAPCAKDALAFLYYLRRELSQGRMVPAQTVYAGGPYQVRLEFAGQQRLTIRDQPFEADRITGTAKGAASETSFEIFVARDKARRPLLIRVPLPLGTFSMELVP